METHAYSSIVLTTVYCPAQVLTDVELEPWHDHQALTSHRHSWMPAMQLAPDEGDFRACLAVRLLGIVWPDNVVKVGQGPPRIASALVPGLEPGLDRI